MLSLRRLILLPLLTLFLFPSLVSADVRFNTVDVSPLTWPWPAAVAPEALFFPLRGVVWADPTSVQYSFTEGATVYHETVIGAAHVGPISATSDAGGDIHACFQAQIGEYGLRYAHRTLDGTWDSEWVVTGIDQGWSCAIGVLAGFGPVVAYVDETVSYARVLRYSWENSLGWTSVVLDAAIPGTPLLTGVTMATDGQAAVHVAWTTGDEVRYCPGPSAGYEVVTAGSSVSSLAVAIGPDDQPRLAILDSSSLFYATRSDTGWAVEPVLPARQNVREMSMAIGYDDNPYLVFVTDEPEDPVFFATRFLGNWRDQPLTETPTYGAIQRPSIAAASQSYPSLHLAVAWNGGALKTSADQTNVPSFAVPRLRASPQGELVSTVDLYSTTQYAMTNQPLVIDFTAPGVMDTVNFCYSYRDTLKRWTDENGTATFRMPTGGAVSGGIRIMVPNGSFANLVAVERSVPMAGVDLEGNGSVTPVDREILRGLMGTRDPRADLDFSGLVDEQDLQTLLDHIGQDCTVSSVGTDENDPMSALDGPRLSLYPNPASGTTTVSWSLPSTSPVRVSIFDLKGRRVRDLVVGNSLSREEAVDWDGRDQSGRPAAGGVYLVRLQTGREVVMRRLVMVH